MQISFTYFSKKLAEVRVSFLSYDECTDNFSIEISDKKNLSSCCFTSRIFRAFSRPEYPILLMRLGWPWRWIWNVEISHYSFKGNLDISLQIFSIPLEQVAFYFWWVLHQIVLPYMAEPWKEVKVCLGWSRGKECTNKRRKRVKNMF